MSLTWMSSMISPPPIGTPIQRSMSEVSNWSFFATRSVSSLRPHPAGQMHVFDPREHHAHGLADLDRVRIDLVDRAVRGRDQVSDQAQRRLLVELDRDHVEGREIRV